jgi:thiamine-phosphate pyrophosphorylase
MIGPVYVVTDSDAPMPVADQARAAAQGGAAAVQIRDKRAGDAEMAALVAALLPEMAALGVRLIVNDRVEVAIATGAHGLHIGQGDGDPLAIRRRIGPDMILGLSVETEALARGVPGGVDYIGAGPVRATATKPDHATPIGFDGLARIVRAAALPTVAIGGIAHADAAAVKAAGAVGMAVVSAISRAPDPQAATRALLDAWRRA